MFRRGKNIVLNVSANSTVYVYVGTIWGWQGGVCVCLPPLLFILFLCFSSSEAWKTRNVCSHSLAVSVRSSKSHLLIYLKSFASLIKVVKAPFLLFMCMIGAVNSPRWWSHAQLCLFWRGLHSRSVIACSLFSRRT